MARSDKTKVNIRVRLNRSGIRAMLRSEGVQADLLRRAENVARAAGPGHEASVIPGKNRARASVITVTREAKEAEATRRNLSTSVDAARV